MAERRRDSEAWHMGMYNMSAFMAALGKALSGKKSKAKYIEKPLYEQSLEKQKEKQQEEYLTEDEKEVERDKLLTALMVWQANFELNHKNSGGDE